MLSTSGPFLLVTRLNTTVVTVIPTDVPSWKGRQNNHNTSGHPGICSRTCIIVWKRPPARLCSCGREILAIKRVPAAYTKSAPTTTMVAAGNPKAQYVIRVSINANKREAAAVQRVPIADLISSRFCKRFTDYTNLRGRQGRYGPP